MLRAPASALAPRRLRRLDAVALRRLVVVVAVALAVLAGSSCTQAGEAPMPVGERAGDPQLIEGRGIYILSCQRCHGPAGKGGAGSALAGKVTAKYPDPQDQADVVANGKGGMPAFRNVLDDAEIEAVVRYTREVL